MAPLIKELSALARPALARHFLALGSEDRRLRFGGGLRDDAINLYVDGIDFDRDAMFAVVDDELHIIGAAHLARGDRHVELGVSVLPGNRGRGVGAALLKRAHTHARNWGVRKLFMHCLAENGPMMHLARKQGMEIAYASGDADAWLELPPADASSRMSALVEQRVALFDYALKGRFADARRAVDALGVMFRAY
jgi:hypothetical protein